jgi:ABC-type transport system involved in cytochrome c biogenesis permease subunit
MGSYFLIIVSSVLAIVRLVVSVFDIRRRKRNGILVVFEARIALKVDTRSDNAGKPAERKH